MHFTGRMHEWRLPHRVLPIFICLLSSGCAVWNELQMQMVDSVASPAPPQTQAEAASTHVAVIAAARWEDYVKAIQPNFTLTPAEALVQSIPATASFQSRVVDAVQLGIFAGLQANPTTAPSSGSDEEASSDTAASSTTTTDTSGGASGTSSSFPTVLGQVSPASNLPLLQGALSEDPFLKYSIASDLYQEVQILNRVLGDAEVRRRVVPYFLRIRVALMPYRRDLSYDAYSDLAFFSRSPLKPEQQDAPKPEQQDAQKLEQQDAQKPEQQAAEKTKQQDNQEEKVAAIAPPVVVPLLVTDNLEVANDAVSAQFLAALSAALTGTTGGVPIGGQLQSLGERLNSALANERNSLRTVGRLGENAIRVRFGATLQASPSGRKAYELLPRTHTLSLLVLMPPEAVKPDTAPRMKLVSRTSLKDTRLGKELEPGTRRRFEGDLSALAEDMNISKRFDQSKGKCSIPNESPREWINYLRFSYVINGDYVGYIKDASCILTNGDNSNGKMDKFNRAQLADIEDLWLGLLEFSGDYAAGAQIIELPAVYRPILPHRDWTVLMTDNGKDATVVRLVGGFGLESARLRAQLNLPRGKIKEKIAAETVSVDSKGVTAVFPSLKAIGALSDNSLPKDAEIVLEQNRDLFAPFDERPIEHPNVRDEIRHENYTSLRYVQADTIAKGPPELVAEIASTQVVTAGGEGRLAVGIRLKPGMPPRSAYIRIAGGDIASVSAGEIDELGRVKAPSSGRYVLSIQNLAPAGRLKVTVGVLQPDAKGNEAEAAKLTRELQVVERQRREPNADHAKADQKS